MGIFGRILAHSAGAMESIDCKTCGTTYRCNIDRNFPYAVCGSCLEDAQADAQRNGNSKLYYEIEAEFERRRNLQLW